MIDRNVTTDFVPQPRRLRFSVDDYYKMIEMGMIENYEKSEIIDGEMVPKMTIGDRHALTVDLLNQLLVKALPDNFRVRVQNPLRVGDFDEPEPDFVVSDLTLYDGTRHPRPNETVLVVEVSDSTLKQDRDVKLPMYAEAGILEAWIVNLRDDVIEVHQNPNLGMFQQVRIFESGERLESSVLPQLNFEVDSIIS